MPPPPTEYLRPAHGNLAHARLPLALLGVLLLLCAATAWSPPAGRLNWALEVGPGLAGVAVLAAVWRRFPMSHAVLVGVVLHVLILVYGGYYTYANTPLGDWAKEAFGFARNHYDRVGHVALGFFPALTTRNASQPPRTSGVRRSSTSRMVSAGKNPSATWPTRS